MGTLLKLEWLKVRKYRAFLLLVALYIVGLVGINYNVFGNLSDAEARGGDFAKMVVGSTFEFPSVWQSVSYISSFLLVIPGLIVIMLMANEYSFRTARQSVISGMSRRAFIDTKIALIFIIALLSTFFVLLTAIALGLAGDASFSFEGIEHIGFFFVQAVSYMSVALVTVMLFKRSGVSIGIYFLYALIVENLLRMIINKIAGGQAGYFLPLESSDKLIPAPSLLGSAFDNIEVDSGWLLLAACVWIAACLMFCRYRFEKSDL